MTDELDAFLHNFYESYFFFTKFTGGCIICNVFKGTFLYMDGAKYKPLCLVLSSRRIYGKWIGTYSLYMRWVSVGYQNKIYWLGAPLFTFSAHMQLINRHILAAYALSQCWVPKQNIIGRCICSKCAPIHSLPLHWGSKTI